MPKLIDLIDKEFGRLFVLGRAENDAWGAAYWICACECGNQIITHGNSLRRGRTKSCGCLHKDIISLPDGEAAFNKLYYSYKHRAEKRGRKWALTKEDVRLLSQQHCFYCGMRPKQVMSDTSIRTNYIYNGIDRIDNEKGYLISNVVSCCAQCNMAKYHYTTKEFLNWAEQLVEYQRESLR